VTTLVACGCSFLTTSYFKYREIQGSDWPKFDTYDFTASVLDEMAEFNYSHNVNFVDLYAVDKQWDYINLASPGATNFFIRLQIEEAVKIKPDYVVVAATSSDRFEIPLGQFEYARLAKNYNELNNTVSSKMTDCYDLTKEKETAIKHYTSQLFDIGLLEAKSYFYLQSGLDLLEKNNIPYVFIPGPMKHKDWQGRDIIWEDTGPWDLPYGLAKNNNHNALAAHQEFLQTLNELTINWN
jgi:hypothetical protein